MLKRLLEQDYRSIVVRYRPWQRTAVVIALLLLVLLVASTSALLAWFYRNHDYQQMLVQQAELQAELTDMIKQRDAAERQLVNFSLGNSIDQYAFADIQQQIKQDQQTIAELSEENRFYKGLMSPTELDRGLSIRSVDWYSTTDPRRYSYKIVVQQTALKHRLLRGDLSVTLVGQLGAEQSLQRYNLAKLVKESSTKFPLRFKYFQNIDGELLLPEGFNVQKVELVARATAPKSVTIEQSFDWQVKGH